VVAMVAQDLTEPLMAGGEAHARGVGMSDRGRSSLGRRECPCAIIAQPVPILVPKSPIIN